MDSVQLQMWALFNEQGHCQFRMNELIRRFKCSKSTAWQYRQMWKERQRQIGERCMRCDCIAWEKSPILNGMCLWCHADLMRIDLGGLVSEFGWAAVIGWFQEVIKGGSDDESKRVAGILGATLG